MQHKLKDIARELGVSTATVSNTLNGRGRVSEETQRKVRSKVEELGYRPSMAGRALRTGRSGVLGLVLPDISNPLFPEIAQAIETAAARAGFGILIADSHGDPDAQGQALVRMMQRGADGIIIVPCRGTRIDETTTPVAVIDAASTEGNSVSADHRGGGATAMRHLLQLGHRKIALVGQSRRSAVQIDRVEGMKTAASPDCAVREIWLEDEAKLDYVSLLSQGFTALVATSDIVALTALTEFQRAGHAVPHDVSVMGFDDLSFSSLIVPGLTSLAQDCAGIAACAVAHLASRLDGNPAPPAQILPMRLVVRESTGPAPSPTSNLTNKETFQC